MMALLTRARSEILFRAGERPAAIMWYTASADDEKNIMRIGCAQYVHCRLNRRLYLGEDAI